MSSEEALLLLFHLVVVLFGLVLRWSRAAGFGGVLSAARAWGAGGSESRDEDDVNSELELELAVEEAERAIAVACGCFWGWEEEAGRAAVEAPLSANTGSMVGNRIVLLLAHDVGGEMYSSIWAMI